MRKHAYRITDEDVERLRDAELDDDAIFEMTVAAALGAGAERLRAGLSLLGERGPDAPAVRCSLRTTSERPADGGSPSQ